MHILKKPDGYYIRTGSSFYGFNDEKIKEPKVLELIKKGQKVIWQRMSITQDITEKTKIFLNKKLGGVS